MNIANLLDGMSVTFKNTTYRLLFELCHSLTLNLALMPALLIFLRISSQLGLK